MLSEFSGDLPQPPGKILKGYKAPERVLRHKTGLFKTKFMGKDYDVTAGGCAWCLRGEDTPDTGLCKECWKKFRRILNYTKWRQYSSKVLAGQGLCVVCRSAPCTELHHSWEWNLYPSMFWEPMGHVPCCTKCHTQFTLKYRLHHWGYHFKPDQ